MLGDGCGRRYLHAGRNSIRVEAAASMALQSALGWPCDPIPGGFHQPCAPRHSSRYHGNYIFRRCVISKTQHCRCMKRLMLLIKLVAQCLKSCAVLRKEDAVILPPVANMPKCFRHGAPTKLNVHCIDFVTGHIKKKKKGRQNG